MMQQEQLIPKFPFRLLEWFCPPHLYEEIEGDLIQRFNRDVNQSSQNLRKAKYRLMWSVICFFRPGIILKNVKTLHFSWTHLNLFKRDFNFKRTNDLIGWSTFFISLFAYALTLEETASFWDCSEFIATSYKLQVPHPPGAPLFLLLGRFFSFFAFGDTTKVAYAINMMSAISSALTILFLYWSIVLIAQKLIVITKGSIEDKKWLIFAAGIVGSLAYAFSDSFWFSAVEAEVYAMSSLFTAFVVWAILKWDTIKDESEGNRWIILVAYVLGLSIGVHLLNLLTLPALALIYYFKKYKATKWGAALAFMIGCISILIVNDFIIPGLPTLAGHFELFFVNTLGLFFGSGVLIFVLLLVTALVFVVRYTHRLKAATANTFALALTFMLIGYGTYATIVIRANFDPPINENAPKDVMSFVRYLRREQYGSRPLMFGPYFTANPIGAKYTGFKYIKAKDKYVTAERTFDVEYLPKEQTILPRAWYPDDKEEYKRIMNLKEGEQPTFSQNMIYMFRHQIGTMYMRYFMWNFAGRENDVQGADWLKPSEWFKKLPAALDNKARNNFFMIPFFLGLIGMFYQFNKDTKNFTVVALLFFMLGTAIVLYLNSRPVEPRERDYIYVGSYYAFTFWIGLSVLGLAEVVQRVIQNKKMVVAIASCLGILAPAIMIYQGWDDHDRSNRFFSADTAHNALVSCDKNGIVFTGGDNDTFPLWYEQEVEDCRTDLRVLVLSYSNGDWYIDQTTRQAYQSPPFKYTLTPHDYRQAGLNNYLTYADFNIKSIDAKEYLILLRKEHPSLQEAGHNLLPSRVITLQVNKEEVLKKGVIPRGMENLVVDQMELKLKGSTLDKSDLLFLDLLTTANWERPIYVNYTSMSQLNLDVSPYAVQEGNVYHILPVKNIRNDRDYLVDTDKTYDRMLNDFKYRGLDDPSVYYTDDYKLQHVMNHRNNLNSLAQALLDKGENEKAATVLNFSLEKMPDAAIAYDLSVRDTVGLLFRAGQKQKAKDIATVVGKRALEIASYLVAEKVGLTFELRKNLYLLNEMQRMLMENQEVALAEQFGSGYERLAELLQNEKEAGE